MWNGDLGGDGADEQLYKYATSITGLEPGSDVLVLNDQTGDLSGALLGREWNITVISDSAIGQRNLLLNLENQPQALEKVILVDSINRPQGHFTIVFLKIPDDTDLLTYQLAIIYDILADQGTLIIASVEGPIKTDKLKAISDYFLPKEPLNKGQIIPFQKKPLSVKPKTGLPKSYQLPSLGMEIISHGGVYSGNSLAQSTRLLLTHFPKPPFPVKTVIDLGCGNGILGLAAARTFGDAMVFCVDESFLAVWSARETFRLNNHGSQGFFLTGDCLEDFDHGYADLILCNPPQEENSRPSTLKMFQEARRVIKKNGEFWTVTQTKENYIETLEKLFAKVRTAAYDQTYILHKCMP